MDAVEHENVDVKGLKRLYIDNAIAQVTMDHFAARQKNSSVTTVDTLSRILASQGREFPRTEIIDFFRKLEKFGCGRFWIGRRGQPTRFEWEAQPISVAMASKGEQRPIEYLDSEDVEDVDDDDVLSGNIRHTFHLRPNLAIKFDLPDNLTGREAARLSEFVKSLPFEVQ